MVSCKVADVDHFLVNFAKFYRTLFFTEQLLASITSTFLAILILAYNKFDKRKLEAALIYRNRSLHWEMREVNVLTFYSFTLWNQSFGTLSFLRKQSACWKLSIKSVVNCSNLAIRIVTGFYQVSILPYIRIEYGNIQKQSLGGVS